MDDIDLAILRALQENGRVSISDIGSKINLSVSAVGERIKKLEKSGVINHYTAIINGKYFNKELTALMFISLESPKFIDSFLKFVNEENDILECHYIAGNYDYMIKIVTNNPETLEKILNKVKGVTGIIKTYTNVVLKTTKNNYSIYPSVLPLGK
ncbi:Lrp/AsnC family transcriptional regulator [Cellulosilyticum sp. I15G10I2]|uniref:Lrp/AsnC family transcriptional regulator n=1 Tax=Cellulosilyticum sp. I15G10I2 TaxID=1892843 RepID=UPI00085C5FF9|nr:Lrp/AsnC family transcriptional regulator [Cellulosilyticum sp. I15G10I2]